MGKSFQLFPDQASTIAPRVDALYFFMLAVTAFFTLLVAGLVLFFAIKYRRREGAPPPVKFESARLEMLWTVVPLLITIVMFVWGAKVSVAQSKVPDNAMEIHVLGKQWMWHISHPDGRREINELTVPVGRPVKLVMSSEDVIHSFYMPAFRIKQDVVPGRYSYLWFEPTEPGEYHLFCAEYCGTSHSGMIGKIVVKTPEAYEAWLNDNLPGETMADTGHRLFANSCAICHSQNAPTMFGLYGRKEQVYVPPDHSKVIEVPVDEAYLRESILAPRAKIVKSFESNANAMPAFTFSEYQLACLVEYIKSLGVNYKPGNQMIPGNKMKEENPQPPDLRSENSDFKKR
jgi:cytochrome c oxidase subunit 2